MPELPDVEVYRQYFNSTALHQCVDRVHVFDAKALADVSERTLRRHLESQAFESTRRHGKYLFAGAGDGGWLVLHFGMTGSLVYRKHDDDLPEHTRVRFDFENGYHLAYVCPRKLGRVALTDGPDAFIEQHELGPDALEVGLDTFRDLLGERGGTIKSALMNQGIIAGLGNVYIDEILFQTGIHPATSPKMLDDHALAGLHRTMRRVLRVAIDHDADPGDLPSGYLLPHREAGAQCPRCGGTLEHTKIAGRTTWLCPACQPEP